MTPPQSQLPQKKQKAPLSTLLYSSRMPEIDTAKIRIPPTLQPPLWIDLLSFGQSRRAPLRNEKIPL